MWRLILVVVAGDFEADRLVEQLLERCDVAVRGPEFELRVPRRAEPGEVVVASRIEIDARQCLGVAPVEPLGKPEHRRQDPDGPAARSAQLAVAVVRLLRRGLPVVPRHKADHLDLLARTPADLHS
jgi:hypothetical protein